MQRRLVFVCAAACLALVLRGDLVSHVRGVETAPSKNAAAPADKDKSTDKDKAEVDYQHDIQPLFMKRCYSCHGPDLVEGSLRLDRKADAFRGGDNGPAILPGKSSESRLVQYITGKNKDDTIMPPEGERLTDSEIALVTSWIDRGATWPDDGPGVKGADHWAFQSLKVTSPPAVKQQAWVRNDLDRFILAKLESLGIEPSPEADRVTQIRRLSLDLLGLLPEPADVDEFVRDTRPDAYERLVDRLLASPHYGERWARHWLDLARYADSDGYEKDNVRLFAWRYRNWVIDALNRDLPFDEFTREQLAGDLLSEPTNEQLVATGFHRNTLTNTEGGVDQEEFRVAATIDRVNTTGNVWLGLTVACAQCHSHKYDPIPHREYYQLYSFFNSVDEVNIPAPLPKEVAEYQASLKKYEAEHEPLVAKLRELEKSPELLARQATWEAGLRNRSATEWKLLDLGKIAAEGKLTLKKLSDGSVLTSGDRTNSSTYTIPFTTDLPRITAIKVEALTDPSLPRNGPGRAYNGNFVLTNFRFRVVEPKQEKPAAKPEDADAERAKEATGEKKADEKKQPVTVAVKKADAKPEPEKKLTEAEKQEAEKKEAEKKKAEAAKKKEGPGRAVQFRFAEADHSQKKFSIEMALDKLRGSGWAISPQLGQNHTAVFELEEPLEPKPGETLTIFLDQAYEKEHLLGKFRLSATAGVTPVSAKEIPNGVAAILDLPADKRSPEQAETLAAYYRLFDEAWQEQNRAVLAHAEKAPVDPGTKTKAQTLVELKDPRESHIFIRGDFQRPGDKVESGTLAVLPPLKPRGEEPDRLDLADWLVDGENPLPPRVTVNRIWALHFGRGIVATRDDFGTQGERPSHPELLDWLAYQFSHQQGWSLKALHKLIVNSATYRQSSRTRPELVDRDPINVLLARQNRLRVEAEVIRDLSLDASGLLVEEIGGPSVRPPQPAGIAELTYNGQGKWPESEGKDRFRRGMYTFFQRSSPYPMLMAFDSPDGILACARRERSNTPLQALTLLNDTVFVECAQALGRRIVKDVPAQGDSMADRDARLRQAFRLCLARDPNTDELASLIDLYTTQRELCRADEKGADELVGSQPRPDGVTAPELAAWVMVGRTLLNLDEFITRE